MKHDLVILNNFIRPQPSFKQFNSIDTKRKSHKSVSHLAEKDNFNNISMKIMGLSNMLNLMNAYQFS